MFNEEFGYLTNVQLFNLIPQSHLLYGGRTVAVELQNRVIPAVAVEILRDTRDGGSLHLTWRALEPVTPGCNKP